MNLTITGSITLPESIFYLPQQTYVNIGTLREQITYPHAGTTIEDDILVNVLRKVKLEYLYSRYGPDQIINWSDLLSPGERQRIALARLFFKKPQFAVLDESTSALDVHVEEHVYAMCKKLNITLLSVGHRPTLMKYHNYLLKLDGSGSWKYEMITHETIVELE